MNLNLEPCLPPRWAPAGHAQTLLGHLLPSPRLAHKGRRIEIPVAGGDRLVAFVQDGSSTTVVYIFHGLAGSTDSPYMHRTSLLAQKLGHTVILVNHRGCGEGAGLAQGPYHSGRAEDLAAAITAGRQLFPRHRHVAIGFSMSGNALLLLLSGQRGGDTRPDNAISVNAPIHLERCAHLLKTGLNRLYDARFYLQCRRDILRANHPILENLHVPRMMTVYDFDAFYTAPAGGFASREHYYQSCSTFELFEKITTPTVMLTAQDDPFVPFESYQSARLSPHVYLHMEHFGGHMGYLTKNKTPLGTRRWQDYALSEILRSL